MPRPSFLIPRPSGHVFEHPLVDENAAAHIALGQGIREALTKQPRTSAGELEAAGYNRSLLHLDIPFGSANLNLDAQTSDGRTMALLRDGLWTDAWQKAQQVLASRSRDLVAA